MNGPPHVLRLIQPTGSHLQEEESTTLCLCSFKKCVEAPQQSFVYNVRKFSRVRRSGTVQTPSISRKMTFDAPTLRTCGAQSGHAYQKPAISRKAATDAVTATTGRSRALLKMT